MKNDFEKQYLSHHGILGQKWGVRRYQNSDGTLTTAGKLRYNASKQVLNKNLADTYEAHQNAVRIIKDANTRTTVNERGKQVYSRKDARNVAKALDKELRAAKKVKKSFNQLTKDFGDETLSSFDPVTVDLGKKFMNSYGVLI